MPSVQAAPGANCNPSSSVQSVMLREGRAALRRLPATKGWKVSKALPMFWTVTVCGPSLASVDPTYVGVVKLRLVYRQIQLRYQIVGVSVKKMLPLLSTAIPVELIAPPAKSSFEQFEAVHPNGYSPTE